MNIYNTTFCIDYALTPSIIKWIKETYVNAAMTSGLFDESMIARVIADQDPGYESYALHLQTNCPDEALTWLDSIGQQLLDDLHTQCGERVVWFRTKLEVIK
jgi:hypothetical protein